MHHRVTSPYRRIACALACAVGLALAACSGGGSDTTAPDPVPPTQQPPVQDPPAQPVPVPDPQIPDPQPPEQQNGIQGTYTLVQINNSQPGQMVTLTKPDGKVIGLYRFDASTQLTLDPLQTFTLQLRYADEKGEYGIDDEGEFKSPGQVQGTLALVFTSAIYDDEFSGVAVDGTVVFKYDFDGDHVPETSFAFQRVGG
jgi:glucose/arabinose dehydrogenase